MATVRHDDELQRPRPARSDSGPGGCFTRPLRQLYGKRLLSGPRNGRYLSDLNGLRLPLKSPATASETQEQEKGEKRLPEYG